MAYCTRADIEEQLSNDELVELTDDEGFGQVDSAVIDRAIADADAEIDAWCGGRYTVPFAAAPAMVRRASVELAIYNLFSRRLDSVPETRKERRRDIIAFLKAVASGTVTLGPDATLANEAGGVETEYTDRAFTRTTMKGLI